MEKQGAEATGGSRPSNRSPLPGSSAEKIGEFLCVLSEVAEATSRMTRSRSVGARRALAISIPTSTRSIQTLPSGLAIISIVSGRLSASRMTSQNAVRSMTDRRSCVSVWCDAADMRCEDSVRTASILPGDARCEEFETRPMNATARRDQHYRAIRRHLFCPLQSRPRCQRTLVRAAYWKVHDGWPQVTEIMKQFTLGK